ncbi:molybdenum cofactor biosynthesis protein B [Pseudomonas putida]|uniref:molybdenum cofactor biosynthesis protein B n=1 Tax=Pseudomonas putida TaxID=303 RepID=UPI00357134BE
MRVQPDAVFEPLNIAVLTVSDTRTVESDTSGALLANRSVDMGHRLIARVLLKDNLYKIRAQVATWIADEQVQVVLITGGTGFTGRDNTPEAVECLLERRVDGFGELFRALSILDVGASTVQSRALAGLSNRTLVCCLPGSNGACRTAWEGILAQQLDARHRPCNFVKHVRL